MKCGVECLEGKQRVGMTTILLFAWGRLKIFPNVGRSGRVCRVFREESVQRKASSPAAGPRMGLSIKRELT